MHEILSEEGQLIEKSNDTELGTRRDPQGELIEEPDSNQDDQVDRLNLSSMEKSNFSSIGSIGSVSSILFFDI